MTDFVKLEKQMGDLEEEAVLETLRQLTSEAPSDAEKALDACRKGMDNIGKRYEAEEYFLGDLICAGDLMSEAVNILKPALVKAGGESTGKLVICTVKGDLHDIGKNIVKAIFDAAGFEVIDLGIDVPEDLIVKTAKENNIKIIALSSVLTLAIDSMKTTVDAFNAAGMRDKVKIIIGGNPVSEVVKTYTGADAWSLNPQEAVSICRDWAKTFK